MRLEHIDLGKLQESIDASSLFFEFEKTTFPLVDSSYPESLRIGIRDYELKACFSSKLVRILKLEAPADNRLRNIVICKSQKVGVLTYQYRSV